MDRLLGSGAQGHVFSTIDPTGCFLKQYADSADHQAELTILQQLRGLDGVPSVLASTSDVPCAILCRPIGVSLSLKRGDVAFLSEIAKGCVCVLQNIHEKQIVHRDLRLSNILAHSDDVYGVLIVDWASAVNVADAPNQAYQGAVHFAADAVLTALSADPVARHVHYQPQDDLECLVKTMFAAMFLEYVKDLVSVSRLDFDGTRQFWCKCAASHPTLRALLAAARACDYDLLVSLYTI